MLLLAHNETEPNYGTHERHTTIIQAKFFWKNLTSIADWTVSKKLESNGKGDGGKVKKYL
jgi:hypothetical protein